jgi:DNA-directed RNA polymerase subunit M/transcription elongation factor TFIIS
MNCKECGEDKIDVAAMRLVMGQEGAHEQTIALHTCIACGHKWSEVLD